MESQTGENPDEGENSHELNDHSDEYEEDDGGEEIPVIPATGWGGSPPTLLLNTHCTVDNKLGVPVYEFIDAGGHLPDHRPVFTYRCVGVVLAEIWPF